MKYVTNIAIASLSIILLLWCLTTGYWEFFNKYPKHAIAGIASLPMVAALGFVIKEQARS